MTSNYVVKYTILSFHLYLIGISHRVAVAAKHDSAVSERNRVPVSSTADISLIEFQSLLYTEVNSEIINLHQEDLKGRPNGRYLNEENVSPNVQDVWDGVVQHGWEMAQSLNEHYFSTLSWNRNLKEASKPSKISPFLICSHSVKGNKSGYQRLQALLEVTDIQFGDVTVVRNDSKKTCYHVSLEYQIARKLRSTILTNSKDDYYTLLPMTDLMKIQFDTMTMISDDSWTIPSTQNQGDWERTIRVGLSAGHRVSLDQEKVLEMASSIINDIKSLGQIGARNRRSRKLKAQGNVEVSLSDLFSLTSLNMKKTGSSSRNLRHSGETKSQWSRSLELGLEADHSCSHMFESLEISVHYDNRGFDIVLNPDNAPKKSSDGIEQTFDTNDGIEQRYETNHGIEDSASNKHCVTSLIMALSTHPFVLSVETEGPIIPNDYEAQWITQSKVVGNRPLRDIGIDGTNQIISIIDSGVDINNEYFGPTDAKVFEEWDHSQRKIVRYDASVGDKEENRGGHGTKVSCVAAGKLQGSDDNEADGIAQGAKLHIIDVQQGKGAYRFPSAYTFFESMHSTEKTPARIANGSFGTLYRPYPFSCKFFDEALYEVYQGDVFIASAGNSGLDDHSLHSIERTIGNPASCKNTIAVGASQSYGDRLTPGDNGLDYLAAFSSRGPTFDGRMKPDIVAPGASVLTAFALENGKTVHEYGTSVAGPVVAGNAALVRQYFEEGKLPCEDENCSIDPSGSLVKAVLLNSAHTMKQVQIVKPWLNKELLEDLHEYDNNQGMGLIQLDKTLPIPGHNNINAIVRNNVVIQDRSVHDIYIKATPWKCKFDPYKRDVSATLSWYDPAGATSCAKCLVNDLDIMVHRVTNRGLARKASKVFPNGRDWKDSDNNVERLRFKMYGAQTYRIRIFASNLSTAETKFSMIASGCFKEVQNPALRWKKDR